MFDDMALDDLCGKFSRLYFHLRRHDDADAPHTMSQLCLLLLVLRLCHTTSDCAVDEAAESVDIHCHLTHVDAEWLRRSKNEAARRRGKRLEIRHRTQFQL